MEEARIKQAQQVAAFKEREAKDELIPAIGHLPPNLSRTHQPLYHRIWKLRHTPEEAQAFKAYHRAYAKSWRAKNPDKVREAADRARQRRVDLFGSKPRGRPVKEGEPSRYMRNKAASREHVFEELLPGHCRNCARLVENWKVGKTCGLCM